MEQQHDDGLAGAPMVGDHLALDLLNTQARSNGAAIDFWHSGDDVLRWLARCGIAPPGGAAAPAVPALSALLTQAQALRALARRLIAARRQGDAGSSGEVSGEVSVELSGDVGDLNTWLHAHLSAPHLGCDADGRLALTRVARGEAIAALLGPVAEAVAGLLVEGDFALVKQCEHPDCILWFYDRTKAHKRRWCSMALCGNRFKAAQFRKRNSSDIV